MQPLIGPAVQIYTPMHPLDAGERRQKEFGKRRWSRPATRVA